MSSATSQQPARTWIDSLWPEALMLSAAALGWWLLTPVISSLRALLTTDIGGLYGALLGLHGTLLGFVLAALTIILGSAGSPQLRLLRDAGQLPNVFRVYLASVLSNAIALAAALLALLIRGGSPVADLLAWVVGFTTALALARLIRTLWVTSRVVHKVGEPPTHREFN